jgi:hypothetical protein
VSLRETLRDAMSCRDNNNYGDSFLHALGLFNLVHDLGSSLVAT